MVVVRSCEHPLNIESKLNRNEESTVFMSELKIKYKKFYEPCFDFNTHNEDRIQT